MPSYEMMCDACHTVFEYSMKISEYSKLEKPAKCRDCGEVAVNRCYVTPPNMTIPANMTHDGKTKIVGTRPKGTGLPVPLNFIDEKPDGSYRVTRVGNTKGDVDND